MSGRASRKMDAIIELRRQKRLANTRLIAEVQSRTLLWDKRYPERRTRSALENLWEEVALAVGKEREVCKKHWKNLLDRFRKIYCTATLPTPNSSATDIDYTLEKVKWIHFKQLLFLKNVVKSGGDLPNNNGSLLSPEELVNVVVKVETEDSEATQQLHETLLNSPQFAAKEETILPDIDTSSEASQSVTPSLAASPSLSLHSPTNTSRLRRALLQQEARINQDAAEPVLHSRDPRETADRSLCFGDYLVSVLREVPIHLRRRCEFQLLQVANAFADNIIPQIALPTFNSANSSFHLPDSGNNIHNMNN